MSGGGRTRDARGKTMDALRAAREAKHLTPHSLRSSRAKLPSQPEEARAPRGSCCAAEDALSREGSCFAAEALSRKHRRFACRPETHGAAPCRRLPLPRRARLPGSTQEFRWNPLAWKWGRNECRSKHSVRWRIRNDWAAEKKKGTRFPECPSVLPPAWHDDGQDDARHQPACLLGCLMCHLTQEQVKHAGNSCCLGKHRRMRRDRDHEHTQHDG